MTVLENSIRIQATPDEVWSVLGALETLGEYDPGVVRSALLPGAARGVGASRQCDLAPGGWFRERVVEWSPASSIAFELTECTLPVKTLKHRYELRADGNETVVSQRMEYELKLGPIG